jgi:putative hemolysin
MVIFDVIITNAVGSFYPEQLMTRLFPPLRFLYLFVSPVVVLMIKVSQRGRLHIEGGEDEEDDPEGIRAFLQAGTEEGIIEEKEKHLLRNLLVFSDTVVREVMTPRTDMICVEHTASPEEILSVFRETKFSRLPVYRENIDQIEGVLRLKDLLEVVDKHDDLSGYLKPTVFVPEMKRISDLLEEMLKERMQMVVVIDEYGGTAGLITLEDLIEEIVGEIHDEHEAPEADQIITLENGDRLIDGKITLEDFCEMFGVESDNEDVDTVGGYIFNKSGRIPDVGDLCEVCGVQVEIARADQRRIYQVKVAVPIEEPQLAESEHSEG